MFEFLERLRQKSPRTKKQIAFFISFLFAGIIFVVWLSVIYPDWREDRQNEARVESLEPTPSSAFGSTISDGFSAIGAQFKKIKEAVTTFSSQAEYYNTASSSAESTTTISQ